MRASPRAQPRHCASCLVHQWQRFRIGGFPLTEKRGVMLERFGTITFAFEELGQAEIDHGLVYLIMTASERVLEPANRFVILAVLIEQLGAPVIGGVRRKCGTNRSNGPAVGIDSTIASASLILPCRAA